MSKLSTIEKKFEITKFLHSKRKMSELERIFDLSDKQVRNLIKDEKVRFLNVEFPLFKGPNLHCVAVLIYQTGIKSYN